VKQGTVGGTGLYTTEDWDELAIADFGDIPGLMVTDRDYTTQSLNTDRVTFLGQITFSNLEKGSAEVFSNSALTAFIRSYSGSKLVTFLLAAAPGYTSTGQARFASKEATALESGTPTGAPGDFAPYLSFEVGGAAVAPSVLITSPANGADVNVGPINIEATATDDGTIAKVEFFAEQGDALIFVGQDTTQPYSSTFNPTAAGTYTLRAVATDNQGLTGEHTVVVDVGVANPPTVAITSPAEGATVIKGVNIIIAATAQDDVSVTNVQFYAGMGNALTLLGEDSTAPYTMDYTPATAGTHTIRVVATDNLGLTNEASISLTVQEPAANAKTVSTAFGLGADAQANEHTGGVSGMGSDLNTRTSSGGDRNELVVLRFDLSEHTLSAVSDVTLNVINFRINAARQVALYGVKQGATGASGTFTTETWEEVGMAFGDVPGLLETDSDFTTQSIDESKVVPLGQITFANLAKGTTETFSDAALTDFVRSYTGSKLVTFILAAAPGYTSTGQARIASKEALALEGDPQGEVPGRYAPFLSFNAGGASPSLRITSITRNGTQLTLQWSGGSAPFTVQQRASLTAGSWTDVATGVTGTTATVNMVGDRSFFRVRGQ
jgi:hypothetical protein